MAKATKVERAPDWARRVHPKLRMMLNADPVVNAFRANTTGALSISSKLDKSAPALSFGAVANGDRDGSPPPSRGALRDPGL